MRDLDFSQSTSLYPTLNAEWTGGVFDSAGAHFYVSVQHNVTGHGVVLDITGWR